MEKANHNGEVERASQKNTSRHGTPPTMITVKSSKQITAPNPFIQIDSNDGWNSSSSDDNPGPNLSNPNSSKSSFSKIYAPIFNSQSSSSTHQNNSQISPSSTLKTLRSKPYDPLLLPASPSLTLYEKLQKLGQQLPSNLSTSYTTLKTSISQTYSSWLANVDKEGEEGDSFNTDSTFSSVANSDFVNNYKNENEDEDVEYCDDSDRESEKSVDDSTDESTDEEGKEEEGEVGEKYDTVKEYYETVQN
ncbi:hypothetical protein TL16_g09483 [Triparma laevis f. inornata]|uniref:Uncharacterized protein n=1 Tax=Triparma laevis f. inornata TaxID=1714386 RepID=A0A9W7B3B2_9STRA|nr:hypothetical protein TL16_g09483 [Triparma laevis f. inornata]